MRCLFTSLAWLCAATKDFKPNSKLQFNRMKLEYGWPGETAPIAYLQALQGGMPAAKCPMYVDSCWQPAACLRSEPVSAEREGLQLTARAITTARDVVWRRVNHTTTSSRVQLPKSPSSHPRLRTQNHSNTSSPTTPSLHINTSQSLSPGYSVKFKTHSVLQKQNSNNRKTTEPPTYHCIVLPFAHNGHKA